MDGKEIALRNRTLGLDPSSFCINSAPCLSRSFDLPTFGTKYPLEGVLLPPSEVNMEDSVKTRAEPRATTILQDATLPRAETAILSRV